jgi:phosphatidylglycerophosphatase A
LKINNDYLVEELVHEFKSLTNLKEINHSEFMNMERTDINQMKTICETCDCLLVEDNSNFEEFLKYFSHLIEFESLLMISSNEIKKNNINHYSFEWYSLKNSNLKDKINLLTNKSIIVSSLVFNNSDFVEILEIKMEFKLFERKFNLIDYHSNEVESDEYYIIIDELTAIFICEESKMQK